MNQLVALLPAFSIAFIGQPPSEHPASKQIVDVPVDQLGSKFQLVGKMRRPLGSLLVARGTLVESHRKGYEDGPTLMVRRIGDRAIQDELRIVLQPYFGGFGESQDGLPSLKLGCSYEIEAYEDGGYVGIPKEAYALAGIELQSCSMYFHTYLSVIRVKAIDPIDDSPADFVGREALIQGAARNADGRACIVGNQWTLITGTDTPWPDTDVGKAAEALGVVEATSKADTFQMVHTARRLVKLEDQLGRQVTLRGTAWSHNGTWWLDYRGERLYVEDMNRLMSKSDRHGCPVVIRGDLDTALLPRLDQIEAKSQPDSAKHFIVRNASWESLDSLLAPESIDRR